MLAYRVTTKRSHYHFKDGGLLINGNRELDFFC